MAPSYNHAMAKDFDKKVARELATRYRNVPSRISMLEEKGVDYTERYLESVILGNVNAALLDMEHDEPIEVLNRFCPRKEEIEQLIDAGYNTLLSLYDNPVPIPPSDMSSITNACHQLQLEVRSSLGWVPGPNNHNLDRIIDIAVKTKAGESCLRAIAKLSKHLPNIEQSLNDIDVAVSSFAWIFLSKDKKQAAIKAASFLSDLDVANYLDNLSKTEEALDKIDKLNTQAIFKKNSKAYLATLETICPGTFTNPPLSNIQRPFSIGSCRRLIDYHRDLDQQAVRLLGKYPKERFEGDIQDAVKELMGYLSLKALSAIPVSDLGQKGYRRGIKELPNYGFPTAAEVATANTWMLADVPGIGATTANFIKHAALDAKEEIEKSTKLKLSTDDKNKYATAVIVAVYRFLRSSEDRRALKAIDQFRTTEVLPKLDVMSRGWGDMAWTISDTNERSQIIEAWRDLTRYSKSSYATCIDRTEEKMMSLYGLDPQEAWDAFAQSPYEFYGILEDIVPDVIGGQDAAYGLPEDLAREIQEECFFPDGLLCDLRRYQELGVKYILNRKRVLLGDEMGLGKTVQAIAAMVSLRNVGETHFIVVCPAGIIDNWCREVMKKSKLRAFKLHGNQYNMVLDAWVDQGGVAVTNYESAKKMKLDDDMHVGMVVVDEAHYIKNKEAQRTQNVLKLCTGYTDRVLFMTGTPIENKVDEMISLMSFLQPNVAVQAMSHKTLVQAPMFRELVAPVYYRRRRDDVLLEMPDLIKNDVWCTLSMEERMCYESEYSDRITTGRGRVNFQALRRVSWNVNDIATASSKAAVLKEIISEAKDEGRKIIVFSFFREVIAKIADMLGRDAMPPITGDTPVNQRQLIIDAFEERPAGTALIAQIIAGGTGLNIQTASVVVICEPQIKPSIEDQAISRAYRMGQTRDVLAYRLLAQDTVDEHIVEMLEEKQRAFYAFADESVAALESLQLDSGEQEKIIEKEIERIKREQAAGPDRDQDGSVAEET